MLLQHATGACPERGIVWQDISNTLVTPVEQHFEYSLYVYEYSIRVMRNTSATPGAYPERGIVWTDP